MSQLLESEEQATPLFESLRAGAGVSFSGGRTAAVFSSIAEELEALREGAGVYDLGWLTRFRITGEDRVRWLNGMVTNTVRDLEPGHLNYTFLLNAQGRIQGDGTVYALPDALLFATDWAQAVHIAEHLDRFIIMDDVELVPESEVTALGVAGPQAAELLDGLGLEAPGPGKFRESSDALLAQERPGRFVLWVRSADVGDWWQRLKNNGRARACGVEAVEALRVLSGVPRYGADIHDKSLAQETGQMRALNFNKGCYLGQEIVERIRSRATVHRALRAFALQGDAPAPGTALFAEAKPDTPVGELTSITTVALPELEGTYALGTVRAEAAEGPLVYAGGRAKALEHAPLQVD